MDHSRRAFLKQFSRDLARTVQEFSAAVSEPPRVAAPPGAAAAPTQPPPVAPAAAPARCASREELLALADELGLGARRAAIDALARRSLRLLPGDPEAAPRAGGSRLGGAPDLPHDAPWPHWRERPLEHRLQLDLAEVAAALGDEPSPLPAHGTLWCFTPLQPPSGLRAQHAGACAVLLGEAPADAEPGYGDAVALAPELVLPRAWSAPVEALALEGEEQLAWQALREHLADVQGVALGDAGRDDDAPQSLHRLLGYPDERHGDMPLACELLDAGAEPGDEPPLAHPRAAELEPRAGRWQLLLQLSHDERVGWSWGDRRARLYAWADERALAAGELAGVRAFVQ